MHINHAFLRIFISPTSVQISETTVKDVTDMFRLPFNRSAVTRSSCLAIAAGEQCAKFGWPVHGWKLSLVKIGEWKQEQIIYQGWATNMSRFKTDCHWSIFLQLEINLPSPAEILILKKLLIPLHLGKNKMCFGLGISIPATNSTLQQGKWSLQKEKTSPHTADFHSALTASGENPAGIDLRNEAGTLGCSWLVRWSFSFSFAGHSMLLLQGFQESW